MKLKNKNKSIVSYYKNKKLYIECLLNSITDTDMSHRPYLSSRYIIPTWDTNDDVVLDLYSTDYNQTDTLLDPPKYHNFTLILNLDGSIKEYKIKSGNLHLNIGKQNLGEHWFTAQIKDSIGRLSHEIYEEFRVIDTVAYNKEIEDNTLIVTDEILLEYEIDKNDNPDTALKTKKGLQRLFDDKANEGVKKIILPTGTYQLEAEFWFISAVTQYNPEDYTVEELETSLQGSMHELSIPNNFIVDLNGSTIKLKESLYWQNQSSLMKIVGKYDSHVLNGYFVGDYRRRDLTALSNGNPRGEGGACFAIKGKSRYCSFENCHVSLFTGYCCTMVAEGGQTNFKYRITNFTNVKLDNNGNEVFEENKWTSDYYTLTENVLNSKTVTIGSYLGNGWSMHTDSWHADFHFFDENKVFIKTIHGFLFREVLLPSNARYIRCTYTCSATEYRTNVASYLHDLNHVVTDYNTPRNCKYSKLSFYDTRTCALNPNQGNNNLIEECTFDKCGTNITPVAVDFEDGWFLMQDYLFKNNEVLVPVGTGDMVIDAGMNLMFVNNKNFRFTCQGNYGVGYYFSQNKEIRRLNIRHNDTTYPFTIIEANDYRSSLYFNNDNTKDTIIKDSTFFECGTDIIPNEGYYKNCIIDGNNMVGEYSHSVISLPKGKHINGTIKNFKGWVIGKTKFYKSEFYKCTINDVIATINDSIIMDNCVINNMQLSYDNFQAELIIKNSVLNNFSFVYNTAWNNSINKITIDNCIIDNSSSDNLEIFQGNFRYIGTPDAKTFEIKNCTLLNGTIIAPENSLNNTNIIWILNNNINK